MSLPQRVANLLVYWDGPFHLRKLCGVGSAPLRCQLERPKAAAVRGDFGQMRQRRGELLQAVLMIWRWGRITLIVSSIPLGSFGQCSPGCQISLLEGLKAKDQPRPAIVDYFSACLSDLTATRFQGATLTHRFAPSPSGRAVRWSRCGDASLPQNYLIGAGVIERKWVWGLNGPPQGHERKVSLVGTSISLFL
jgi:hypothetical protein